MITNKEHHKNVTCQTDSTKVSQAIANQNYLSLEEIYDDFYDILSEKKVTLDIPVALGFSVLQYGKLRMLQFDYDYIDRYVSYYIVLYQTCRMLISVANQFTEKVVDISNTSTTVSLSYVVLNV